MCVICYVPRGVPSPSKRLVEAMHRANPHGCGFVTPSDHYRGMSFNTLLCHLKKRHTDEPCLLHFRLATHGSVRKSNCHPFFDASTRTWFMHNGVLDIRTRDDMTDSETAFRDILVPELSHGLNSDNLRYAVESIRGFSRFAFMQGEDVQLYGQYEQWHGWLFSNLRFQW